ncbi:MAG: type II toxin-antitoxin system VapC family toxin [Sterolibacterium sp.]
MIALDTNVLARAIVEEAAADSATRAQQQRARALLSSGRELFVPLTVVQELEWVLRSVYGMPAEDVALLFDDLLAVENIEVDRAAAVSQAVGWYRNGLDFSDALHLAQVGLCESLSSFDAGFVKLARRLRLKPPVSAPA